MWNSLSVGNWQWRAAGFIPAGRVNSAERGSAEMNPAARQSEPPPRARRSAEMNPAARLRFEPPGSSRRDPGSRHHIDDFCELVFLLGNVLDSGFDRGKVLFVAVASSRCPPSLGM